MELLAEMEFLRDYGYDAVRLAIQQNNNKALIVYKTNMDNMITVASRIRIISPYSGRLMVMGQTGSQDRQPRPAEPAVQDPRDPPDRERRDYGRNREENEQRKVEGFKTKFRLLRWEDQGNDFG